MDEPPLIGRTRELDLLVAATDLAAEGTGRMVWVEGEAGIGKTALADEARARAGARGFATLAAGAAELEGNRPFRVVAQCLGIGRAGAGARHDAVAQALAAPPDGAARPVAPVDAQLEPWLVEQLVELTEDACASRPLLMILEDLHWADASSLGFVGRIARAVTELPLLVIATTRRAPRSAPLERLMPATRRDGARLLELGALDDAAALALADRLTSGADGRALGARVARCGGNPLYISELVRAHGDDPLDEGLPDSLGDTLRTRLGVLEPEALRLLELASVIGTTFSVVDVTLLAQQPAAALWPALRSAIRAGFLVEDGARLAFRHDVVCDVVRAELPAAARAALHLDLGRALAAAGAPVGRVAEHLARGAQPGDRDAVLWLARAARDAAASGPEVAVRLLRAALELADADDPARGPMTAQLAFDLIAAGRREEGETLSRDALDTGIYPAGEGALRLSLTESLMVRGRLGDAMAEAGRTAASPGVDDRERAHALAWLALGPIFGRDLDVAQSAAVRARDAGVACGEIVAEVKANVVLGMTAGLRANLGEAEGALRAAADGAQRMPTRPTHAAQPHLAHATALAELDRFDEAHHQIVHAARAYGRLGMQTQLAFIHVFDGYRMFCAGHWDDAMTEMEASAVATEQADAGWQLDPLAIRAILHARRDELQAARTVIDEIARQRAAGATAMRMTWTPWATALVCEAEGDVGTATEGLWEAWQSTRAVGSAYETIFVAGDLARMLAAAGDVRRGSTLAAAVDDLAARNPEPASLHALASRCRALADQDSDALVVAARQAVAAARPYEAVAACEAATTALATDGRRDEARLWGQDGIQRAERLGAVRDAMRIGAVLRTAGVRRGSQGPRARPASGWASLTPSETRIALLVADGLSNPQIADRLLISRRTVSTHVSNVLRKLELRSRVQLAARVAREAPGLSGGAAPPSS